MRQRVGTPLLVLGFALIGLAWPFVQNLAQREPEKSVQAEKPEFSIDKIIEFCLNPKHENSKLCIVKNPEDTEQIRQAVEEATKKDLSPVGNQSSVAKPIIVRSETQKVQEKTNTQKINNTSAENEKTSSTSPATNNPQPNQSSSVNLPKIPDSSAIEVPNLPEPDVPDVDVPDTGGLLNSAVATSN